MTAAEEVRSPAVQSVEVSMDFGRHRALRTVTTTIMDGDFVALVGPSGCGKSTFLRLVAGLTAPTDGQLTVEGAHAVRVAFVYQEPTLLPWRTVADNIGLPLEIQKTARTARDERIRDAIRLIGLEETDTEKRPAMLSGGMKMRVSLARALVTDPRLLLLDEPFAALDDLLRQQLNEELLRIWQRQRWTALFVTHNVGEAAFLSQRILVFGPRPGTLLQEIDVPFDYPREPELRGSAEFARFVSQVTAKLRKTIE